MKKTDSVYEGNIIKEYTIKKATPQLSLSDKKYTYSGQTISIDTKEVKITPNSGGKVSIKYYTDKQLKNEIKSVVDAGTYYMQANVVETSNYTSALSNIATLTIERKSIDVPVQQPEKKIIYNGTEQTLLEDTEYYTVTGDNVVKDVGDYRITVTPTGNYVWPDGSIGPKTITYTIDPYDMSEAPVEEIPSIIYDGSKQKPKPNVTVPLPSEENPTTLTSRDVEYSYDDNKNAGTATVTIIGKGNYTGKITKEFTIDQANGYISISENNKNIVYGTNTITFDITSSHGGEIEITDDNSTVTETITGNRVTVTNLGELTSGTIVNITIKSKETNNYKEASTTYELKVTNATLTDGSVTIKGHNVVGQTLTTEVVDTTPVGSYTYKWYRNDTNSTTGGTAIEGATGLDYTVTNDDVGKYIYVEVTASRENYDSVKFSDIVDAEENDTVITKTSSSIPTTSTYCKTIKYTGTNQVITNLSGEGYAFYNNSGKDVGNYTVTAKLQDNYIWSDYTTGDKTFTCSIEKSDTATTLGSISSKEYDGESLTASGATSTLTSNNSSVSGSYTYTYYNGTSCSGTALSSAPINAGDYSVKATLTGTSNYNSSTSGCVSFEINPKSITCTSNSGTKVYDGTPLTAAGGSCTGLLIGHTATLNNSGSITDVSQSGTSNNAISSVLIKSGLTDVSNNYNISKVNGTLTITARPVTYTATDQVKDYDGTPLEADSTCTLTSGTLVSGHVATCTTSGSITNGGSTTKSITNIVINSGTTDVTGNYLITKINGTLTVKQAMFNTGQSVNAAMKTLAAGTTKTSSDSDELITSIKRSSTLPDLSTITYETVSTSGSIPIYMWYDNGTLYYYTEIEKPQLNADSSYLFRNLLSVETIDLITLDTKNVENMQSMFANCESLKELDLSNFNTSNVTNMSIMFQRCLSLETLDLRNFDTSKVTNMSKMFLSTEDIGYMNLREIKGIENFDTSNVTNMNGMFQKCNKLESLDLTKWNTSNVTNMWAMFNGCSGLTSLDLSNFNTSKVTNMAGMFEFCSGLTSLNVSSFDTREVTNMGGMFDGCSGLTTLDVSHFDTSKVTDMSYMFRACSGLTSLDVSNFDTSNVTNMQFMFSSCSNLETIYTSDKFVTTNVVGNDSLNRSYSYQMFYNDTKLVGGNGTVYDSSKIDKEYARIDTPDTPGYFTDGSCAKFATDSWNTIKTNVNNNTSAYAIGCTKEVDMGTFGTHTVRVANNTTPSECSTSGFSQSACGFVVEFTDIITTHRMNPYTNSSTNGDGNKGGWEYSEMRTYVNSDIYNALPTELKNAIIDTTVVSGHGINDSNNFTTTDKLYLLSTVEVGFDVSYDSAKTETRTLDYYAANNTNAARVKKLNNSATYWWLRSAYSDYYVHFNTVDYDGNSKYSNANDTAAWVVPAFRIG